MSQARARLSKLVGQPKKLLVTRGFPREPTYNGFVLGLGRDLVLLHQFHDFYPEGFTALRVADIERVRSGEHERFWERMFRGEGVMGLLGISYSVPLDEFRSLLTALKEMGKHVIIECESRETEDDDNFFIGRVLALKDWSVSLLNFDPLGVWDDQPTVIAFGDITKVQFDTPYINTLSRHLRSPRPK